MKLLTHLDGDDGAIRAVDLSAAGRTLFATGGAQIDTASIWGHNT